MITTNGGEVCVFSNPFPKVMDGSSISTYRYKNLGQTEVFRTGLYTVWWWCHSSSRLPPSRRPT